MYTLADINSFYRLMSASYKGRDVSPIYEAFENAIGLSVTIDDIVDNSNIDRGIAIEFVAKFFSFLEEERARQEEQDDEYENQA